MLSIKSVNFFNPLYDDDDDDDDGDDDENDNHNYDVIMM